MHALILIYLSILYSACLSISSVYLSDPFSDVTRLIGFRCRYTISSIGAYIHGVGHCPPASLILLLFL